MEVGCELEVDVNGEETFMVDSEVLARFLGKFRKLSDKSKADSTRHLKVILQDFPGGAHGFELVTRFCYNNGIVEISPSNLILLNSAAYFMEMDEINNSSVALNLVDQTENYLEGINYWTWSELVIAMKQCQDIYSATDSSFLLQKVLDSIMERLSLLTVASSSTCSSNNFSSQFPSDISSTCSTRNNLSPPTWWFQDLLFLNVDSLEKLTRKMISEEIDHGTISKFLFSYLKSKLLPDVMVSEKRRIMEIVINLLCLVDRTCLSCKTLFEILRIVSKRVSKCSKLKLERLIGSKLDEATLDHLLVRPPYRKNSMYDVNLILRLVEGFLFEGLTIPSRLKKVASLMDSFLVEVASDFLLKPEKFSALLLVLPGSARESSDKLYQAIDLYIEVHTQLCQEERIRLCSALNPDQLSAETLKNLAENSKFPSMAEIRVFTAEKSKQNAFYPQKTVNGITYCSLNEGKKTRKQVHPFARKEEYSVGIKNLGKERQNMQWRVRKSEKNCPSMKSQKPNVAKRKLFHQGKVRSFPRLCSC